MNYRAVPRQSPLPPAAWWPFTVWSQRKAALLTRPNCCTWRRSHLSVRVVRQRRLAAVQRCIWPQVAPSAGEQAGARLRLRSHQEPGVRRTLPRLCPLRHGNMLVRLGDFLDGTHIDGMDADLL